MSHIDKSNTDAIYFNTYDEPAGDMNSKFYTIEYLQEDDVAISSFVYNNLGYFLPLHTYNTTSQTFTNSQIIPVLEKTVSNNEMLYFQEDFYYT